MNLFDTNTTDEFGNTQYIEIEKEKEAHQKEKELDCEAKGGHFFINDDYQTYCEECGKLDDREPDVDAMVDDLLENEIINL